MLRLKNLTNKFQKRTLRVIYGPTQAYPYAATLDSHIGTGAAFTAPASSDTTGGGFPLTRSAAAFTLKSGLVPGLVMVNTTGDTTTVAAGGNTAVRPFGLLANFVGGDLDELGDQNTVGVWRGPDSVYEVLAPAFDPAGLSAFSDGTATAGAPLLLYAGTDGRLVYIATGSAGNRVAVARLLDFPAASRIVIEMIV